LGLGQQVEKALDARLAKLKEANTAEYAAARAAGEMEAPVEVRGVVQALNDLRPRDVSTPEIEAARRMLIKAGGAVQQADGTLAAAPLKLGDGEEFRKAVGGLAKDASTGNVVATLKRAYDADTVGAGGELFKKARASYAKMKDEHSANMLADSLISTKKGSTDRKVAYEKTLDAMLSAPRESLVHLQILLRTGGPEGLQAQKELRGSLLNYLLLKGDPESEGQIINPAALRKAVRELDKAKKLDVLFGKRDAEKLRSLANVVGQGTTPPKDAAITHSNTGNDVAKRVFQQLGVLMPGPVASLGRGIAERSAKLKHENKMRQHLESPP
jgi:hypothetical protein